MKKKIGSQALFVTPVKIGNLNSQEEMKTIPRFASCSIFLGLFFKLRSRLPTGFFSGRQYWGAHVSFANCPGDQRV